MKKYKKRGEVFQLPSGTWAYDFQINRQRYRGTIKEAQLKKEALQAVSKMKTAIFEDKYNRRYGKDSFEDFVKSFWLPYSEANKRTYREDCSFADILINHKCFKGRTLAEIAPDVVRQYQRDRRSEITNRGTARMASSVNREIARLSSIFNLAISEEKLEINPCRRVRPFKIKAGRDRFLTREEETKLLGSLKGHYLRLRPLIILALNAGMRRNEMLRLKASDIDLTIEKSFGGRIVSLGKINLRPETTKNGKARTIPLNEESREVLLSLGVETASPDSLVFNGRGYCPSIISKLFTESAVKAGLMDVVMHTLRHTFETRLKIAKVHPFVIRDLMGHSDLKTTLIYDHAEFTSLKEGVDALKPAEVVNFERKEA